MDDPDLAAFVARVKQRRGPRSRLLAWQDDSGWHPLRADEINHDVRERVGADFTAKDFRTLHGTVIAAASLARAGADGSPAERRRATLQAVRETAAALGNTPAVARASYIDPRLLDAYERGTVVDLVSGRTIEAQIVELLGDQCGAA